MSYNQTDLEEEVNKWLRGNQNLYRQIIRFIPSNIPSGSKILFTLWLLYLPSVKECSRIIEEEKLIDQQLSNVDPADQSNILIK